jgi:altronate dehydratase small subunit
MVEDAILISDRDNVATALRDLPAGSVILLSLSGGEIQVKLVQDIPFGHKFALKRITRGEVVVKYGEAIGIAVEDIEAGEHVHIHNVRSNRGK